MSKTYHHKNQRAQHYGEDLWSRRAVMGHERCTTYNKRLTVRKERGEGKRLISKNLQDFIDERADERH